jgi:hypothetical protein
MAVFSIFQDRARSITLNTISNWLIRCDNCSWEICICSVGEKNYLAYRKPVFALKNLREPDAPLSFVPCKFTPHCHTKHFEHPFKYQVTIYSHVLQAVSFLRISRQISVLIFHLRMRGPTFSYLLLTTVIVSSEGSVSNILLSKLFQNTPNLWGYLYSGIRIHALSNVFGSRVHYYFYNVSLS